MECSLGLLQSLNKIFSRKRDVPASPLDMGGGQELLLKDRLSSNAPLG
jgi:hypothetical protein